MRSAVSSKMYAKQDITTRVQERDPAELITLLFDSASTALRTATMLTEEKLNEMSWEQRIPSIETFHRSTTKAVEIILSLRELLDLEKGAPVAQALYESYTAIANCILLAGRERDTLKLEKMLQAINELRSGWASVSQEMKSQPVST